MRIFLTNTASVIHEVHNPTESLLKPSITWRKKDEEGFKAFSYTGDLEFFGADYDFIFADLWTSPNALTNEIELKFVDDCCSTSLPFTFSIRAESITWCEGSCRIEAAAIEKSIEVEALKCLRNTLIYDDTASNTTSNIPFSQKQHPRFTYCNEIRPAWQHDFMIYVALVVAAIFTVMYPIVLVVHVTNNIVNSIVTVLNNLTSSNIPLIDFDKNASTNTLEEFRILKEKVVTNIIGCGKKHPAPLVRSYIENVCGKCGLGFNSSIFNNPASDYFNACYHYAPIDKGLDESDTTSFWIEKNKPILTGSKFLDQLKATFNADWQINGNQLTFERRDFFQNKTPFLDLTVMDSDDYQICYGWSKKERPSFGNFQYTEDSVNTVGSEARRRWGDIVEWNSPPLAGQKGELEPRIEFAACRFRDDGVDRDVLSTYRNFIHVGPIIQKYDRVIILNQHLCYTPMLLIWDGLSVLDARVSPTQFGSPGASKGALPSQKYNYPMWFDNNFTDNMYSRFWEIENPRLSGFQKKTYEVTIELTCALISVIDLDGMVKTSEGNGKIDEIALDYKSKTITIKGEI